MQTPYELLLGWRYTRAGRATRRNGFISFISAVSMAGIALGVAALIIVLSVMNGFQKEVLDHMLAVVSHIEIEPVSGGALDDADARMMQVRQQPQVRGVAPFAASQALLSHGADLRGVAVRGIDPALEPEVSAVPSPVLGAALQQLQPGAFGIVLGGELARQMGVRVGDRVTLAAPSGQVTPAGLLPRLKQMQVVGLLDSGHFEYDAGMAWVHLADAQRLFRLQGPGGIRVRVADMHGVTPVAQALARDLGPDVRVRDWTQQNRTWYAAVQLEKRMMFIILALIVAVAAFNLVSTLVMTVTDKRADIAILRTLGASPRSIMAVFVVQGAAVGVIGTLAGLLLGAGVAWHLDTLVPALERLAQARFLPTDIYLVSHMPSDPRAGDIVPVALMALVLSFAATLYPSWRASRVNPAQALRYE